MSTAMSSPNVELVPSLAYTPSHTHDRHVVQLYADDSIREVRTVSYLLYPPMLEEMDLKSAIPWYLDGFSTRSGIKTTFEVQTEFGRLPRESELALFRVLQEGLTNVHRHSGSPTAHVRLLVDNGMAVLEIEDSGKASVRNFWRNSARSGWALSGLEHE